MASRPANVLIVDDDPAIRQVLRRSLDRLFDVNVLEADDGRTALELLGSEPVDLVLLDVVMRFMNGVETLEAIRRSPVYSAIPVVMLTSTNDEAQVNRIMELKVADFLVKPVTLDAIQARLGPILDRAVSAGDIRTSSRPEISSFPWELRPSSRVLVVDDDPKFREFFATHVRSVCRVDEAESSMVALRYCFANRPDAVFLGDTPSALLSDRLSATKLRAAAELRGIRVFRIAEVDQIDAAKETGLYDGVIARSADSASLVASLEPHLDAGSVARLLLGPMSPCVQAMSVSTHSLLQEMLGTDVRLQPATGIAMPVGQRWVSATLELRCAHQLWRITMAWVHGCALRAASGRLGLSSDLVSESRVEAMASDVVLRLAQGLQRALLERSTESAIGTPVARFVSPWNPDVDALAKGRTTSWYSTNNGSSGALLRLAIQ